MQCGWLAVRLLAFWILARVGAARVGIEEMFWKRVFVFV